MKPINEIWCAKCKTHTLNKDALIVKTKNNKTRQISTCIECLTKKSRFIKTRDAEGGAIPDSESTFYANIAASSYESEDKREGFLKDNNIDLEQDNKLSDNEQAVYVDEKDKKDYEKIR